MAFKLIRCCCHVIYTHGMVEEKLPQQFYNVLKMSYETFYHFFISLMKLLQLALILKRHHVLVNHVRSFCCCGGRNLAAAQFKLIELTIIESVQKLSDLETEFISTFSLYTIQEVWLLKTRNHLEKCEKKLRLKKLKKIRMLAYTDNLYFACLERFESH